MTTLSNKPACRAWLDGETVQYKELGSIVDGEWIAIPDTGNIRGIHDIFTNPCVVFRIRPEPEVIEGWVNAHQDIEGFVVRGLYLSKKAADQSNNFGRIACIPIKFTVGEGL